MARHILTNAMPVTTELDKMIYEMETALGKQHAPSPFSVLYQKYMPQEAKPVFTQAIAPQEFNNIKEATAKKEKPSKKEKPVKEDKPTVAKKEKVKEKKQKQEPNPKQEKKPRVEKARAIH